MNYPLLELSTLANNKAFKFLTKPEKHDFKIRQAELQQEAKNKSEQKMTLKNEQELEKAQAAFTE